MDILYISAKAKKELLQYCEEDLVNYVFTDFQKTGEIIEKEEGDKPYRLWIITDYVKRNDIDIRKKFSVILSMAAVGGFIQIGEAKVFGDVRALLLLSSMGYITDDDRDYFIDCFANCITQVRGLKNKFTV